MEVIKIFSVESNNIFLSQGDTALFSVSLYYPDDTFYPLLIDDRLIFSIKKRFSDRDIVFQKVLDRVDLSLSPSETEKIPNGKYLYDIVLKCGSGNVHTVADGTFEVRKVVHT